jgi:hypothetical protein
MKKLLFLISVTLMLTGCVAYPVYDSGYYPDSGPYPYGYVAPNVNLFVNGGHEFHGGDHGFNGGGHGFHGGGHWGGGRR